MRAPLHVVSQVLIAALGTEAGAQQVERLDGVAGVGVRLLLESRRG